MPLVGGQMKGSFNSVNFLLEFEQKDVERLYQEYAHEVIIKKADIVLAWLSLIVNTSALFKTCLSAVRVERPILVLVNQLTALCALYFIHSKAYKRWRTWSISALRVYRLVITAMLCTHAVFSPLLAANNLAAPPPSENTTSSAACSTWQAQLLSPDIHSLGTSTTTATYISSSSSSSDSVPSSGAPSSSQGRASASLATLVQQMARPALSMVEATIGRDLLPLLSQTPCSSSFLVAISLPLPIRTHIAIQLLAAAIPTLLPAVVSNQIPREVPYLSPFPVSSFSKTSTCIPTPPGTSFKSWYQSRSFFRTSLPLLPPTAATAVSAVTSNLDSRPLLVILGCSLILSTVLLYLIEYKCRLSFLKAWFQEYRALKPTAVGCSGDADAPAAEGLSEPRGRVARQLQQQQGCNSGSSSGSSSSSSSSSSSNGHPGGTRPSVDASSPPPPAGGSGAGAGFKVGACSGSCGSSCQAGHCSSAGCSCRGAPGSSTMQQQSSSDQKQVPVLEQQQQQQQGAYASGSVGSPTDLTWGALVLPLQAKALSCSLVVLSLFPLLQQLQVIAVAVGQGAALGWGPLAFLLTSLAVHMGLRVVLFTMVEVGFGCWLQLIRGWAI